MMCCYCIYQVTKLCVKYNRPLLTFLSDHHTHSQSIKLVIFLPLDATTVPCTLSVLHTHTPDMHTEPAANYTLWLQFSDRLCCHFQLALTWQLCNESGLPGQRWDMGSHQPSDVMSAVWLQGSTGLTRVRVRLGRIGKFEYGDYYGKCRKALYV